MRGHFLASAASARSSSNATEPVVRREWLRQGSHVNSVGFTRGPELEPSVFANARVVVESRDAAIGEFPNGAVDITTAVGQKIVRLDDIREVGELVQKVRTGRTGEEQITVYRSVGVAAQDAAAAGLVLEAAAEKGSSVGAPQRT
jgi:ornithine cyclodeaminase